MEHDPYATAFKDNEFSNNKMLAKNMRSEGMPFSMIKERTGVDYHSDNVSLSPLDPYYIDTRSKEDIADSKDLNESISYTGERSI